MFLVSLMCVFFFVSSHSALLLLLFWAFIWFAISAIAFYEFPVEMLFYFNSSFRVQFSVSRLFSNFVYSLGFQWICNYCVCVCFFSAVQPPLPLFKWKTRKKEEIFSPIHQIPTIFMNVLNTISTNNKTRQRKNIANMKRMPCINWMAYGAVAVFHFMPLTLLQL